MNVNKLDIYHFISRSSRGFGASFQPLIFSAAGLAVRVRVRVRWGSLEDSRGGDGNQGGSLATDHVDIIYSQHIMGMTASAAAVAFFGADPTQTPSHKPQSLIQYLIQCVAPVYDSVQLVNLSPITMVYDTYNKGLMDVNGVYKPINITGAAPHCSQHIMGMLVVTGTMDFFLTFHKKLGMIHHPNWRVVHDFSEG